MRKKGRIQVKCKLVWGNSSNLRTVPKRLNCINIYSKRSVGSPHPCFPSTLSVIKSGENTRFSVRLFIFFGAKKEHADRGKRLREEEEKELAGIQEVVNRDNERLESKEKERRLNAEKERKAREKKAASRAKVRGWVVVYAPGRRWGRSP